MTPIFKYTLVVIVVLFFWFVYALSSQAGVLRGDQENCYHFASIAGQFAEARDQGLSLEEALAYTNEQIAISMGQPTSIVGDESDAAYIRKVVREIWVSKNSPTQVQVDVLVACMRKEA